MLVIFTADFWPAFVYESVVHLHDLGLSQALFLKLTFYLIWTFLIGGSPWTAIPNSGANAITKSCTRICNGNGNIHEAWKFFLVWNFQLPFLKPQSPTATWCRTSMTFILSRARTRNLKNQLVELVGGAVTLCFILDERCHLSISFVLCTSQSLLFPDSKFEPMGWLTGWTQEMDENSSSDLPFELMMEEQKGIKFFFLPLP